MASAPGDVDRNRDRVDSLLARAAGAGLAFLPELALGVPVGMANMCGEHAVAELATHFPGLSSIVDGEGEVRARLGGEECAIVDEVMHGDLRRQGTSIGRQRYWAAPMPWYSPAWPATQHLCAVGYRLDHKRRRSARSASAM